MIKPKPWVYQGTTINAVSAAVRNNKRALMVMATGLGKTLTSAWVVNRLKLRPVLFLIHNIDILYRAMEEYRKVMPGAKFGIFTGKNKSFEDYDVVFASVQALQRNLFFFSPNYFRLILCDEGHHFQAPTFKKIIRYFHCPRIAMTATPDRMDMKDIRELFGKEVVDIPLELAIARGWLPRIEYHLIADISLNEVYLRQLAKQVFEEGERIPLERIKRRLFVKAREEKVVKIIESYNQKAIVFCPSISHANNLARLFVSSATYHSGNTVRENSKSLEDLQGGIVQQLCAVDAFNEGIHVPDVGLVAFVRNTASETVFRQQLGRGLHPGGHKLIALDFAGSIERIRMIKNIVDTITRVHKGSIRTNSRGTIGFRRNAFVVSGKGFEFSFSEQVVNILKVFDRLQTEFYPTWQEASSAAVQLGIKTNAEYKKLYRQDPRLPATPYGFYSNFPGWKEFLQTEKYPSWQVAAEAARKLGFKTKREYIRGHRLDACLPPDPKRTYPSFPGWNKFFGKEVYKKYSTWEDAGRAARRLGIRDSKEYLATYKQDPHLPHSPYQSYSNFPGWAVFLKQKGYYPTWQEAAKAARKLGCSTMQEYRNVYKRDPRLPSTPLQYYPDFPGWEIFIGKVGKYPTWQEAAKAAQKLGFRTQREYKKGYKKDPRLVMNPNDAYPDWLNWKVFLHGS